jgi:transposase
MFPATVQGCLPEDHPARFVMEIVDRLDFDRVVATYAGNDSRPSCPAILVALLFYGYATGAISSRELPQAT